MLKIPLSKLLLCAALFGAVSVFNAGTVVADPQPKIGVCHANCETCSHVYLELPPHTADKHLDGRGNPLQGHDYDFLSTTGNCNRGTSPTPTGTGTPPPTPTPEPITILLFGAGLAGVGYASRRFLGKGKAEGGSEE